MKSLDEINLREAEGAFLIANTPVFLLRRLQEDAAVRRISETFEGEQLLELLKSAATAEPKNLREAVLPYALLAALSLKSNEPSLLRRTTLIVPARAHRWLNYIRTVLIQTRPATSWQVFELPTITTEPTVSLATQAPTSFTIRPENADQS